LAVAAFRLMPALPFLARRAPRPSPVLLFAPGLMIGAEQASIVSETDPTHRDRLIVASNPSFGE
ncbi:hypothetical protein N4286_13870, partial [Staphylococcus aureus]|uniref:hypothetical protein n=1 Tax=Staphylococcus aureus TaxID=1280 RepID=UPI0021B133A7